MNIYMYIYKKQYTYMYLQQMVFTIDYDLYVTITLVQPTN